MKDFCILHLAVVVQVCGFGALGLLGGPWVVFSGVISRITITQTRGLIALPITLNNYTISPQP